MTSPIKAGDLIADKYRVDDVLGQGGMGVVVAAVHVQLGHRVAIKFLLPAALEHAATLARFEREARSVVALQSDHVSRVFDVGRLPDGAPYIVMELLDGVDLGHLRHSKGRLPAHEAVGYVIEACDAIAEAHALGIVHRDIKPSNLFLAQRARRGPIVKVLDFGISKASDLVAGGFELTNSNDLVGSPLYMSPEQLRGSRDVDKRADIWSLGATLFELIAGTAPFGGTTLAELSANILTEPAPDVRSCSGASNVPAGLAAVISRCLEKSPAARYPNVEALIAALEPFRAPAMALATNPLASTPPLGSQPSSMPPADPVPPVLLTAAELAASDAGMSLQPGMQRPVPAAVRYSVMGALLAASVVGAFFALRNAQPGASAGTVPSAASSTLSPALSAVATPAGSTPIASSAAQAPVGPSAMASAAKAPLGASPLTLSARPSAHITPVSTTPPSAPSPSGAVPSAAPQNPLLYGKDKLN